MTLSIKETTASGPAYSGVACRVRTDSGDVLIVAASIESLREFTAEAGSLKLDERATGNVLVFPDQGAPNV